MSQLAPIPYSDAQLRAILERVKTIAMVGASSNWNRPSYFVMKYMQGKGYRLIPARRAKERPAQSHNLTYAFETRAVHAGAAPDPVTGARSTPIYQTTSYVFDDVDHAAGLFNLHNFGYIYSRLNNPTVAVLEERIASLEGGRAAVAAASGHAAQFLIFFTLLQPGDEFVASRNLYGGSLTQFGLSFKKLGWKCHFVDPIDPENFRRALTPQCKAIFVENLANPGGVIVDIEKVAQVAHDAGIPLIVDNTLATPY